MRPAKTVGFKQRIRQCIQMDPQQNVATCSDTFQSRLQKCTEPYGGHPGCVHIGTVVTNKNSQGHGTYLSV
jgi:hypothetical protein